MKYECGHKPKPIFLKKTDIVFYEIYKQWKESGSKLCFDCWNEIRKKEFLKECSDFMGEDKEFDEKFKKVMHKTCLQMIGSEHDHIKIKKKSKEQVNVK